MLTLHLPPPVSVNKHRRIDWRNRSAYIAWREWAGKLFMEQGGLRFNPPIKGRYAAIVTIDPHHTKCDLDNTVKAAIDFLVTMGVVEGDGPMHMREITVKWGPTKHGTTVSVIGVP